MGIAEFFVRKRILSCVAMVAPSNLLGLSSESQLGRSSFTAEGSITLPESIWAPISPAFSRSRTRKSSLPAAVASCLSLMAALRPAGPDEGAHHVSQLDRQMLGWQKESGRGDLPPPTMQTSTSSLSRSCCRGSKESSTVANRRHWDVAKACRLVGV